MAIIAKGNQRSGGRQLAAHLLNARDNERVKPGEWRGTAAPDLHGAFAEWELQAKATRCSQPFYHLSVSPDHSQAEWTEADYYAFLDQAEERLGLQGQARAVVFHVKEGRHHCHCVWSRIDVEQGRAIHLSNDRMKLRQLVQDVALERGLELPDGLKHDKGSERTGKQHTQQAEQKQQERSGLTKAERTAILTAAWEQNPEAREFVEAMGRAGFTLARGDGQQRKTGKESKPVYVVIDGAGEVHSLARQIEGVKSKEIFTRLQDGYALDALADVATVRAGLQRDRQAERTVRKEFNYAAGKEFAREVIEPSKAIPGQQREPANDNKQAERTVRKEFNYAAGKEFAREVIDPSKTISGQQREPANDNKQDYSAGQAFSRDVIDRDRQDAEWQDAVDKAGIAYVEEQRRQFLQGQATERAAFERHGEEMTARHSATWGETIHRHAAEMAEAHAAAPTGYQSGTMAEAEQAASSGLSFLLGLFASIVESATSLTGSARKSKRRSEPGKPKKRETERREQEKRDQHQQEINAIMAEQAHERESYERRRVAMLHEQQRAREHFEQQYADPSALQQAFEIHGGSYRAELERMAARKEARQERERDRGFDLDLKA